MRFWPHVVLYGSLKRTLTRLNLRKLPDRPKSPPLPIIPGNRVGIGNAEIVTKVLYKVQENEEYVRSQSEAEKLLEKKSRGHSLRQEYQKTVCACGGLR